MKNKRHAIEELFAAVSLGAPENAVGFVLWRVVHRYQREIDRELASIDLTHLQFTTLAMAAWLTKSGEPATQTKLAKAGDMHAMQLSLMLKALEAKGLITRARNLSDVRAKRVEVSSAGLIALRKAMPLVIAVQRRMFGAAAEEGGTLLNLLRQVEFSNRERS